ncbi:MAG TPA: ABC transporter ATP-binding protein [Planctomycetota bacterium]|nr:ABC transporter ATP-binding protein [Planctomycetota bacterium]
MSDAVAEVKRVERVQNAAATTPALVAREISRDFYDGGKLKSVLTDVSLELHPREVVALVGRSGSGKSTLLHILGLLDRPSAGEVIIQGKSAAQLSERDRSIVRNACVGFVFQHFFLLPDFNVIENVLMPAKIHFSIMNYPARKKDCEDRAHVLLKRVGLFDHLKSSPRTLSGGERQRVALARALFLEPKILLCDEPTGNLDRENGERIMDLIFQTSADTGAAVMIVTHDEGVAQRAHRRLHLESGVLKGQEMGDRS